MTIGGILDGYQTDRERKQHSPTLQYSVTTLKRHIGPLTAELLTKEVVEAYQEARRKEGPLGASAQYRTRPRPLSDGTLIRELGVLRRALAWATEKNPPWLIKAPHVPRPEAPPERERWLTRHEAKRLIEAADAPHVVLFVMLALHTAHRAGAILDLTWDRVDFNNRHIDLGKAVGRKRRSRHLPINDALYPYLQAAWSVRTTRWVVEYRSAQVGSIKTGFKAAVSRGHLRNVTPHTLRHTAVTWMMQRGVPVEKIASYAAMSTEMVEKRYGHHSPEWMREAADALSNDE